MSNIVADRLEDCPQAINNHWWKAVLWPSGDMVFSKKTKPRALGLSNPAKLNKPRTKRGLKGLTSHGRRVVRSGGRLLEKKYGRKNLSFITTTLPDLSPEELEVCVNKWGPITHAFLQECKRELLRHGIKTEYLFVTEIQPKRWKDTSLAYPHLHLVLRGRLSAAHGWALTTDFMSRVWKRILENHLQRKFKETPITSIESIKRSVVNYLSKYLSKGLGSLSGWQSKGEPPALPSAWFGLSRSVLAWVKRLTLEIPKEKLSAVFWRVATCSASNKCSCTVLSLLDVKTGFMWPVAATAYIWSNYEVRLLYDSFYDGKHPF